MTTSGIRWPAEWEPHDATWIAWPHREEDWPGKIEAIGWVYAEIVRVLSKSERVEILCHDEAVRDQAAARLDAHGVDRGMYRLHMVATNRSWLRDSAPTGVATPDGPAWIGWGFNGWAKYPNHDLDDAVPSAVADLSGQKLIAPVRSDGGPLVLEGGGIEGNGAGTMLVTAEWLLSDVQIRNPGMTGGDYEAAFAEHLGIERTIWLGDGIVGDDTHGHVDDLARFTDPNTVVLAYEPDPDDENHRRTDDNLKRLEAAADAHPGGLRVVRLPMPEPVVMDGERLPASYANFYIANKHVLVPTFNDPNDRAALATLAELFPSRTVVGIHSTDLVWGLGTLHCLTQQQPAG